ncbi:MAG: hypothetical protein IPG45_11955 [Deltaproteobacteria bacterium]|nr:hypothetical protein [Deltaproteobacteria bacterium]
MRRLGACCLGWFMACSAPPEPVYPPRAEIGPPFDVARTCVPPYPSNVGNDYFHWADLDQGTSCVVYLERDDCALAVYQECVPEGATTSRQWQGRTYNNMLVRRMEFSPASPGGVSGPTRNPTCCEGDITTGDGGYSSSVLTCWLNRNCGGPLTDVPDHVGLVLQQVRTGVRPEQRIEPDRLQVGAVAARTTRLVTREGREELYLLVDSPGTMAGDGLHRVAISASGTQLLITATSAQPLQVATDATHIYLADGDQLHRVDGETVVPAVNMAGQVLAMAPTSMGLLIATADGANSTLRLLDRTTLAELSSSPRVGRISALAAGVEQDAQILAVASYVDRPALEQIDLSLGIGSTVELKSFAIPSGLKHVADDTYGFLAPCWNGPTSRSCYWEHAFEPGGGRTDRTSAPDIEDIRDFVIDPEQDYVHLSSSSGRVSVLGRLPLRPLLDERVPLTEPTSGLARGVNGRIWVLLPNTGALARLEPIPHR